MDRSWTGLLASVKTAALAGRLACRHHLTGREPQRLCPPKPGQQPLPRPPPPCRPPVGLKHHTEQSTQNCKTVCLPCLLDCPGPRRAYPSLPPAGAGFPPGSRFFPRCGPQAEAAGGHQLPPSTLCVLRWTGAWTARDCLSVAPHRFLPCAGDATDSGLISLFLSLPPFIYQA